MYTYNFEYVKNHSEHTICNDSIILCDDYNTIETYTMHNHSFYEIEYITSGEGVNVFPEKSLTIQHGSILIIRPNLPHAYFSTNNLNVVNICLLPTNFQTLILDKCKSSIDLNKDEQLEFETLYYLLSKCMQSNHPEKDKKAEEYLSTILKIISFAQPNNDVLSRNWSDFLLFVTENISTVNTQQAAEYLHISLSAFCRYFKRNFGKTFTEFMDRVRLEKAKELLINKAETVDEISYKVGFSHPTRFYRKFRQSYGITPHQYVNSVLQKEEKK